MTAQVLEPTLTPERAERLTMRISLKLDTMADAYQGVMPLIREAVEGEAWRVLGFNGVSSWAEERFSGALTRLGIDTRREVVRELTAAGMSTRAIAPVVGVDQANVVRDLKVMQPASPDPEPQWQSATAVLAQTPAGGGDAESETPPREEAHEAPLPRPSVQGRDGKTYTRPEPQQPKRRPLADGFRDLTLDLAKVITRAENLVADDRFSKNKGEVTRYAHDLARAIDALQRVVDQMS